jgi:flagellar FliL protein
MTTMANRTEAVKAPSAEKAPVAAVEKNGATQAAARGGGVKAYLPLLANVVLMPVLAYAMTAYVLVPKLAGKTVAAVAAAAETSPANSHAAPAENHGAKAESPHAAGANESVTGKTKVSVPLSKKTLVNVSGTMGTRYLLAEFILVGTGPNFRPAVEKADAELRDAAASALSNKTISDLEKPGVRNLVRTELITIFNSILGKGMVSEIYLTEFAIQ